MTIEREILEDLRFPIEAAGYGTIVADPPWSFDDKGHRGAPDWKDAPIYQTMPPNEILHLPVDLLAAEKAHLYCWTTDTHLRLALNCMEAWGFDFKKILVWVKRSCMTTPIRAEDGEETVLRGPLAFGMGHYYRTAKEICLFGTRGKQPGLVHNLPDVIEQPRLQHSRKPDQLLEWAEKMSPGPRIELFARRSREGWQAWGDQFPGHDVYLRAIAAANKHRMSIRAGRGAALARRAAKIEAEFPNMIEGISRWAGRCPWCQETIAAGDLIRYLPDDSLKICALCALEIEITPDKQEELPF